MKIKELWNVLGGDQFWREVDVEVFTGGDDLFLDSALQHVVMELLGDEFIPAVQFNKVLVVGDLPGSKPGGADIAHFALGDDVVLGAH